MRYYAQLKDGVVVGITEAAGRIINPNMVPIEDMDTTLIGATYANGVFTRPAPVARKRLVSRLAFENRYTDAELLAIELARADQPTGQPSVRQAAARLRVIQRRLDLSRSIDMDDSRIRAAVQAQEEAGHLAAGRALAILDAPVLDTERP